MTHPPRRAALRATLAVLALLPSAPARAEDDPSLPLPAAAAPAPGMAAAAPEEAEAPDPPAHVGRLARVQGGVSFRLPGEDDWSPARLNHVVVAGSALWTEAGARAAIDVGRHRISLDSGTDLAVAALEEAGLLLSFARGAAFLRLRGLAPGEAVEVVTPRGAVTLRQDGRYLVEAGAPAEEGRPERPTRIAVLEGAAAVSAEGLAPQRLAAGQALALGGAVPPVAVVERAGAGSPLVAWAAGAEPRTAPPASAARMTGVEDLALHGSWARSAEHGDVWYPEVAPGWVPYRQGEWRWIEPWGWTWVDGAPWGFAPSHYGRWVRIGPRWAWAPRPVAPPGPPPPPVWAPAVVAFFGGVVLGAATAPVAWVPLGPREPWYPWYRCSPGYVRAANLTYVTNVVQVTDVWSERRRGLGPGGRRDGEGGVWDRRGWDGPGFAPPPRAWRNRAAATMVPAEALLRGRPIATVARPATPAALAGAPGLGVPPLRPETRPPGPRAPGPAAARHAALTEGRPPEAAPPRGAEGTPGDPAAPPGAARLPAGALPSAAMPSPAGVRPPAGALPPAGTLSPAGARSPAGTLSPGAVPRPEFGPPPAAAPRGPDGAAVVPPRPGAPARESPPRPAPAQPPPGLARPGAEPPARPAPPLPASVDPGGGPVPRPQAPAARPGFAGRDSGAPIGREPPGPAGPGTPWPPRRDPPVPTPAAGVRPPEPPGPRGGEGLPTVLGPSPRPAAPRPALPPQAVVPPAGLPPTRPAPREPFAAPRPLPPPGAPPAARWAPPPPAEALRPGIASPGLAPARPSPPMAAMPRTAPPAALPSRPAPPSVAQPRPAPAASPPPARPSAPPPNAARPAPWPPR